MEGFLPKVNEAKFMLYQGVVLLGPKGVLPEDPLPFNLDLERLFSQFFLNAFCTGC
jgi:hypothetical protein